MTRVRERARALGWFSIALGVAELVAGRRIGRAVGQRGHIGAVRLFGAREVATGIGLLTAPPEQIAGWMWGRVAGDALDLAALATGAVRRPFGATLAALIVMGVTATDLMVARAAQTQAAPPVRLPGASNASLV